MTKKQFNKFKYVVTWHIEDGYVSGSRPQKTTIIPRQDYLYNEWLKMSEHQKQEYEYQCVEDDFNNRIGFFIENKE